MTEPVALIVEEYGREVAALRGELEYLIKRKQGFLLNYCTAASCLVAFAYLVLFLP